VSNYINVEPVRGGQVCMHTRFINMKINNPARDSKDQTLQSLETARTMFSYYFFFLPAAVAFLPPPPAALAFFAGAGARMIWSCLGVTGETNSSSIWSSCWTPSSPRVLSSSPSCKPWKLSRCFSGGNSRAMALASTSWLGVELDFIGLRPRAAGAGSGPGQGCVGIHGSSCHTP
jgi:hypothetical protein